MQEKQEIKTSKKKASSPIVEFFSALWGGKEQANNRLLGAIGGVALLLSGYFLGSCELLFSTYPLGIALLCASGKHTLYVLFGVIASAFSRGGGSAVFIGIYAVTFVVRLFSCLLVDTVKGESSEKHPKTPEGYALHIKDFWGRLFYESVWLKMSCAAIAAFCLSLYAVIAGGFRYYDLFGAFFSIVTASAAVFVFSGYFDPELRKTKLREIAILALLAALTYAARNFTVFGVYMGAFLAFFATLCICRRRGILIGSLCGFCLGIAFDPIYAPLFILEAAASGALWSISAVAAATAGCIVGMIWGVYVNGITALSTLLPALLCGAMIFGAADKLALISAHPELIRSKDTDRAVLDLFVKEQMVRSSEQNLRRLSSAFSELAEAFFDLSDCRRRPHVLDLRRMCDSVYDCHCPACPKRELCWGVEYSSTLDVLNRITGNLHTKARAEIAVVPEYMRLRCEALPKIIEEINESCARLTEQALLCDRTKVFAIDYDGISQILTEAVEGGALDYIADDKASEKVCERLKELRFSFDGAIVYGGRKKSVAVLGLEASRAKIGVAELASELSDAIGTVLGDPVIRPEGTRCELTASTKKRFFAKQYSYSMTALPKEDEKSVCGDTVNEFESCSDKYYALISDGMGAGREAALTSRICSMFLEKMLSAGNRPEISIKLLNSFMSERDQRSENECSATVDLFELDLLSGEMAIIKSGAAPTYIKRGGNCFKLQAKTVPLGIFDSPDAQRLRFPAEPGDLIVMVSDGVTQSREDCVWLVSMLTGDWGEDISDMARLIAERAREEGSDDDITVSIIKIGEEI